MTDTDPTSALPQGDPGLLDHPVARRLLASTIPARMAYVAADGTPRIVPTWFRWTGEAFVMPTFIHAPHVHRPAARLRHLRERPDVALTIDTESFPSEYLAVRGRVEITEVDGVDPDYAASARHYMGEEAASELLMSIDVPGTRMAVVSLRPAWVGLVDFQTRVPAVMAG
jgi:hypothetical protein